MQIDGKIVFMNNNQGNNNQCNRKINSNIGNNNKTNLIVMVGIVIFKGIITLHRCNLEILITTIVSNSNLSSNNNTNKNNSKDLKNKGNNINNTHLLHKVLRHLNKTITSNNIQDLSSPNNNNNKSLLTATITLMEIITTVLHSY